MKLVSILILAIILGGGFFLYKNWYSSIPPTVDSVAVFVDKNTYSVLESEINQYVSDIESDSSSTTVKLFVDDFQNPQQVRSKLITLRPGLKGSVLIGNIPIPYFKSDKAFSGGGGNIMPSDRYYMDLERGDMIDEDNDGNFEYERYQGKYSDKMPDTLYWVGRIKSYNNDVEMVRSYFKRNHLYRTGQIKPQKSLLSYSMNIQSGPVGATLGIYENNMKDSFSSSSLYTRNQVSLIVGTTKQLFLNELQKDYETASINAHGNWLEQEIGEGIIPQDIVKTKPKPYFYYLLSCSNGDFSKDNYLGGHYLFDGNGLAVLAYTFPSLMGADESKFYMEYVAQGKTFGEAFVKVQSIVNEMTSIILGDPTLKIR